MVNILADNRALLFLASVIPGLAYAFIIFISIPRKQINLGFSQLFFSAGIIAEVLVTWFLWVFPKWQWVLIESNKPLSLFLYAFFQVALLEECAKMLMFLWMDKYRAKMKPGGVFFYCMSVSAGFAAIENVTYLQMYGPDVLAIRAYSAIVLHMITGLMMGYFAAVSMMRNERRYLFYGLFSAMVFHGVYDYALMMQSSGIFDPANMVLMNLGFLNVFLFILGPGLVVAWLMWRRLKKIYVDNI